VLHEAYADGALEAVVEVIAYSHRALKVQSRSLWWERGPAPAFDQNFTSSGSNRVRVAVAQFRNLADERDGAKVGENFQSAE
jgi:hypothetical protein